MNDWNEKFEYSLSEQQRFDIAILKDYIPGCIEVRKTSQEEDKKGIDYIAKLNGGAEILIDAKTRMPGSKKYWKNGEAELALETWSVVGKKKGWTLSEESNVDYILYTFNSNEWDKFYLFPFQMLRKAFIQNGREWCERYGRKTQYSNSWTSECVFVPASVVLNAVSNTMQYKPKRLMLFETAFEWFEQDGMIINALKERGYNIKQGILFFFNTEIRCLTKSDEVTE